MIPFRSMRMAAMLLMPLVILVQAGCSLADMGQAAGKMAKVAMDPKIQVGPAKDLPSVVNLSIYGARNQNMNEFNEPSPVDLWVFQLADGSALSTIDYDSLIDDPQAALGPAYVSHRKLQLAPEGSLVVRYWEVDPRTRAIGVAVGYTDIGGKRWRAIEAIRSSGEDYTIVIPVTRKKVALQVHR